MPPPSPFFGGDLELMELYRICKIAVDTPLLNIDKPYDYRIDLSLCDYAEPGMRVLVPFGRSNRRTNGLILSIGPKDEDAPELKAVLSVLDDAPIVTPQMLRLVLWMKERCFCTFFDALKAVLPAGLLHKTRFLYSANKEMSKEQALSLVKNAKNRKALVELLFDGKRPFTEDELAAALKPAGARDALTYLVDAGIAVKEEKTAPGVSDKKLRMISLAVSAEEAYQNIEKGLKRPVYRDIVGCLLSEGRISQKELCYMTGATPDAVGTLISRGVLVASAVEVYRRPHPDEFGKPPVFTLSPEQQSVLDGLIPLFSLHTPKAALLRGVTGSGKTNVYIRLIEHVIGEGRGALMLVPEISLTPQLLKRFYLHFGDRVAVFHSALSSGERYDEWKRIREKKADVVVGTRSAVFAPMSDLGLIIIDEEQESTYKSENTPRYHARDIAKFRCVQSDALLLMGSATPSVETYFSAKSGKIELYDLQKRYLGNPLPDVVISDMRQAHRQGFTGTIGPLLLRELEKNINCGEQSILFINRRGNSRLLTCSECGYIPTCANCSVPMSYHSANGRLLCHYCGYSEKLPELCPECHSRHLRYIGFGTQKVEEELRERLKGAKIIRMDSDTTTGKLSHEKLLSQFASGKTDILLGTQMIAKGLDFDNVTLVGVLDADLMLYCDDYRASERAFSLLTQVAGRAGRRDKPGRAVIQTYTPQNAVLLAAAKQDYPSFYESEIRIRQALNCPPFTDIVFFSVSGEIEHDVLRAALRLSVRLTALMKGPYADIGAKVLGPAQAGVLKVNKRYRYFVSFRANAAKRCRNMVRSVLSEFALDRQNRGVSVHADINPPDLY